MHCGSEINPDLLGNDIVSRMMHELNFLRDVERGVTNSKSENDVDTLIIIITMCSHTK